MSLATALRAVFAIFQAVILMNVWRGYMGCMMSLKCPSHCSTAASFDLIFLYNYFVFANFRQDVGLKNAHSRFSAVRTSSDMYTTSDFKTMHLFNKALE